MSDAARKQCEILDEAQRRFGQQGLNAALPENHQSLLRDAHMSIPMSQLERDTLIVRQYESLQADVAELCEAVKKRDEVQQEQGLRLNAFAQEIIEDLASLGKRLEAVQILGAEGWADVATQARALGDRLEHIERVLVARGSQQRTFGGSEANNQHRPAPKRAPRPRRRATK